MLKQDIEYLASYIPVDKELKKKIERHRKGYNFSLESSICGYYFDWEDFCSDWCSDEIGCTRTEVRQLLHSKTGEFMGLPNNQGIIRFVI